MAKTSEGGVSKRMLVAIVVMIAVILVPMGVLTTSTCEVVVKLINMDTEHEADCWVTVYGGDYGSSEVFIDPGEELVMHYPLKPGTYQVHVHYWFVDSNYTSESFYDLVELYPFETEKVVVELERRS